MQIDQYFVNNLTLNTKQIKWTDHKPNYTGQLFQVYFYCEGIKGNHKPFLYHHETGIYLCQTNQNLLASRTDTDTQFYLLYTIKTIIVFVCLSP